MGGGVAGKSHFFSTLPHNFMTGRHWGAVGSESTDGQVFAVLDEFSDGEFRNKPGIMELMPGEQFQTGYTLRLVHAPEDRGPGD